MFDEFPPEESAQEAFDRFHVVGAKHPPEVVMQLQVGGRAVGGLHRPDQVRAFVILAVEEAAEDVAQIRGDVVEVVQNDHLRQIRTRGGGCLALFRNVLCG